MALDDRGWSPEGNRFDDIGIERALPQESCAADYFFGLKDLDKAGADDLPLFLGVEHAGESLQEKIGSVDYLELYSQLTGKNSFHALALTGARQAGLNENAFKAGTDGAINESGRHRGRAPSALDRRPRPAPGSRRSWSGRNSPSSSRPLRRKSLTRNCAAPARRTACERLRDGTESPASGRRACGRRQTASGRCARCVATNPAALRRDRRDSSRPDALFRRDLRTAGRARRWSASR